MSVPLIGFALTLAFFYLSMHLYTAQFRALCPIQLRAESVELRAAL